MSYHISVGNDLFTLTYSELMQWLFDGKLKPTAYMQKGHKNTWQKISESEEWNFFYGNGDGMWVILKKQVEKNSFRQKGPYSEEQISFFLKIGLCSARDFIWKEGFEKWQRISLIPEFCTHPADTIRDILIQQGRKYKAGRARMIRYSPSGNIQHYPDFQTFI